VDPTRTIGVAPGHTIGPGRGGDRHRPLVMSPVKCYEGLKVKQIQRGRVLSTHLSSAGPESYGCMVHGGFWVVARDGRRRE
jgi:hypothetical protein